MTNPISCPSNFLTTQAYSTRIQLLSIARLGLGVGPSIIAPNLGNQKTIASTDRLITIRHRRSKIPEHHPLKLFIEPHHHRASRVQHHLSRCFLPPFNHSSLLSSNPYYDSRLNRPVGRHSFHFDHLNHDLANHPQHPHLSINPRETFSSSSGSSIDPENRESCDPTDQSWWRCSPEPPEQKKINHKKSAKDSGNLNQIPSLNDRVEAYEAYSYELSDLQHSSRTTRDFKENLKKLLEENSRFRGTFDKIWSSWNLSGEKLDKEERSQLAELQSKSIQLILETIVNSVTRLSRRPHDQHENDKIGILDELLRFLIINHKNANKILSILGLDPIKGWRNSVKESLRIQTLKTLISFLNLLDSDLLAWWSSETSKVGQANQPESTKLAKFGIFLILALSKEGSVWKALEVFRMMDKFPRFDHTLNVLDDQYRMLSDEYRAATALMLADALRSRKNVDSANHVLETVLVDKWLGPIYRRYLLTMLMIKAARGEISEVERIGSLHELAWIDSNPVNLVAGKNKRTRVLHVQDPRVLVARAKIEALGILGETRQAVEIFQETVSSAPPKLGVPSQLPDLYAEMMRVHLKTDDPRAIEQLLKQMIASPDPYRLNQPDQRHYNILLQAYANRIDIEGCSSVLDRLLRHGIRPDIYTYGNICLLFSNLGEPDLIRAIIQALSEFSSGSRSVGLRRELWNILLDAYIESGDWSRTAKLLEYLELDDSRRHHSDVVTSGCVLKALVLSGSPTDKVLETFKSIYNVQSGLIPDVRSYTLLLLSICDSGMMDLAEAIFHSLKESPSTDKPGNRRHAWMLPNVYMYGIMISAFIRLGKPDLAQNYLSDMLRSGIRPNLVIYSMLTSAYAASRSSKTTMPPIEADAESDAIEEERREDGVRVAHEMAARFRRELLEYDAYLKGRKSDTNPKKFIQSPYVGERPILRKRLSYRLLGPIIQSYAKSARPAKALEVFRELVASLGSEYSVIGNDGKPIDIDIFTMLMDGYRKAQDPVGVMEVWKEIFRLATETNMLFDASDKLTQKVIDLIRREGLGSNEGASSPEAFSKPKSLATTGESGRRRQANRLCLPLSIYTDCLSRHGYHEEIANTWHNVQESGFGFDAGNWNELCAAMFRSGNHRMGWWISERVFFGEEQTPIEQASEVAPQVNEATEATKWAKLLSRTVGFRSGRTVLGLEGTRLSGAQKTESPLRPPNRSSIRETWRFDNELATRLSVKGLLNWLKDPDLIELTHEYDSFSASGNRAGWGEQLNYISQARRELVWKPYEKVFRMLHGSMWRECSDLVIKKWEEILADRGGERSIMDLDGNATEIEEIMKVLLKEVIDGYEEQYPKTIVEVLAMNDNENLPVGMSQENLKKWNKDDFIIRVIRRTFERMRDWPKS